MLRSTQVILPPLGVPLIHILRHGFPFCHAKTKLGVPADWPKGHKWVTVDESGDATCDDCKAAYKKYRGLVFVKS